MNKILLFWIFIIMLSSCTKNSESIQEPLGVSWPQFLEEPVSWSPVSEAISR